VAGGGREILDGDEDSNRGDRYGKVSEGRGEGTKMHLFPSLSLMFSLFRMQNSLEFAEIVPAFALV